MTQNVAQQHQFNGGHEAMPNPAAAVSKLETISNIATDRIPQPLMKRSSTDSPNTDIGDNEELRISFDAFGKRFHLHLEQNRDLVHEQARVNIYAHGKLIESRPISARVYRGRVLDSTHSDRIINSFHHAKGVEEEEKEKELGWARITVGSNADEEQMKRQKSLANIEFEGVFTAQGETYHIKSARTYEASRRPIDAELSPSQMNGKVVIYRGSDMETSAVETQEESFCGHDHLSHAYTTTNLKQSQHVFDHWKGAEDHWKGGEDHWKGAKDHDGPKLYKRANPGCPTAKKILYMGVAADCTYVSNYKGVDATLQQILSNWNQASKLYEENFNVALGVITVNLQTTCDEGLNWNKACAANYLISQRLSDFSQWRGTQNADAGLWHLMTTCSSGATVGVAWVDTACQVGASAQNGATGTEYISGTGVSSKNPNEWIIISHEIGHNFGAIHDCTAQLCASSPGSCRACDGTCDCGGKYIMHPTSDVKNAVFSPSSIRDICSKNSVRAACLNDPGTRTTIDAGVCGNGIKEAKEECDCGPATSTSCTNNPCCDGSTCKLKAGAKCSDNNDLCCSNCQLLSGGTVCRPSRGSCDTQEVCSGSSGDCPIDTFLPDLQQCTIDGGEGGQCASGECTSRAAQCKAKGVVQGITGECSGYSNRCDMFCSTSDAGVCVQVSGFYLDGTACSYNGVCENGSCKTKGFDAVIGWFQAHLAIGIALLVIVVFVTVFCLARCFKLLVGSRKNAARRAHETQLRQQQRQRASNNAYPADVFLSRAASAPVENSGWVDARQFNGPPQLQAPQQQQRTRASMQPMRSTSDNSANKKRASTPVLSSSNNNNSRSSGGNKEKRPTRINTDPSRRGRDESVSPNRTTALPRRNLAAAASPRLQDVPPDLPSKD
eukprot:Partr_v1_DN28126_c0_g1_i3_m55820 putative metallo-protease